MLLWKRYVNNKMAAMRFLHLQQYSHRLDLLCVFLIIKMRYVQNQWYDISCATLYLAQSVLLGTEIYHEIIGLNTD